MNRTLVDAEAAGCDEDNFFCVLFDDTRNVFPEPGLVPLLYHRRFVSLAHLWA
jgi:hypothetical protein